MDPTLLVEAVKWGATLAMVTGAVLVSLSLTLSVTAWPYLFFLAGHVVWAIYGFFMIKDTALVVLNLGFIPLDLYAIHIRINNTPGDTKHG